MILLCAAVHGIQAHDRHPIVSPYIAEPPIIDGDLSEWDTSAFIRVTPQNGTFDGESDSTENPEDLSFAFGIANDDQYLYVAVHITDDILVLDTNRNPSDKAARAWMDDAIEIFIDGDHSHSPEQCDGEAGHSERGNIMLQYSGSWTF